MSRRDDRRTRVAATASSARPRTATGGPSKSCADDPAFQERLHHEFPRAGVEAVTDPVARRTFLKLMGASLALAGADRLHAAAGGEDRPLRPRSPRRSCPGRPLFFATAMPLGGVGDRACWSRATRAGRRRSRATRSTRPASARPTSSRRRRSSTSTTPTARRRVTQPRRDPPVAARSSARFARRSTAQQPLQGRGPAHPDRDGHARRRSPRRSATLLDALPAARWHQYEPVGRDNARAGAQARVRRVRRRAVPLRPGRRHPRRSTPTSSAAGPARLRYARDFAAPAAARAAPIAMNRLYAVESMPTLDRRARPTIACRCAPSEIEAFARALAAAARRRPARGRRRAGRGVRRTRDGSRAVADDLPAHRGREPRRRRRRPAAGRPRARARDQRRARQRRHDRRLHRAGRGRAGRSAGSRSRELVADMDAGAVDAARHPRRQPGLHRAGRPRASPSALAKVPLRVHLGLYDDETVGALPLARPRGALPRGVERRARLRRHGRRSCSR